MKQSTIATRVGIDKSAVSKSISRLKKYGYLEVVSVPKDRRMSGYKVAYLAAEDGAAMGFWERKISESAKMVVRGSNRLVGAGDQNCCRDEQPNSNEISEIHKQYKMDGACGPSVNIYSIQNENNKKDRIASDADSGRLRDDVRDLVIAKVGGWSRMGEIPDAELDRLCDLEIAGKLTASYALAVAELYADPGDTI